MGPTGTMIQNKIDQPNIVTPRVMTLSLHKRNIAILLCALAACDGSSVSNSAPPPPALGSALLDGHWRKSPAEVIGPHESPSDRYLHIGTRTDDAKTGLGFAWCNGRSVDIQIQTYNASLTTTPIYKPAEQKWVHGIYLQFFNAKSHVYYQHLAEKSLNHPNAYTARSIDPSSLLPAPQKIQAQFNDGKTLVLPVNEEFLHLTQRCMHPDS